MTIYLLNLHSLRKVLILEMFLLLVGCAPTEVPTTEFSSDADAIITRFVPTATVQPTSTATPLFLTRTLIPIPTDTSSPSPTLVPTQTPPPWLVTDFSPFLLYNVGEDIYLMRPNGENRFISQGLFYGGQPWSPDGLKIIFSPGQLSSDAGQAVTIANLITGETQRLTFDHDPYTEFHWSPDGNFLFYEHRVVETNVIELRVYDLAAKASRLLAEIPQDSPNDKLLSAGWSSDGRLIAFVAKTSEQYDLFVIETETLNLRQLTFSPDTEVLVAWSPVANHLILGTNPDPFGLDGSRPFKTQEFQLIDDTGNQLALFGPFDGFITTATWSPDGQQIAYSIDAALCILKVSDFSSTCPLEGTALNSAKYALAWDSPAAWSLDGHWLAFQAIEIDSLLCYELFLFDLTTNTLIEPDSPSCTYSNLYWSRATP